MMLLNDAFTLTTSCERSIIQNHSPYLKKGVDFNRKWHQFHERVHFWGVGFIFKGKGSKLRVGVQLDFEP